MLSSDLLARTDGPHSFFSPSDGERLAAGRGKGSVEGNMQ